MSEPKIVHFQSDARLLEELGERLVSKPDVAALEIVKNSFDADAQWCHISYDAVNKVYIFEDNGSGMNEDSFLNKWMKIATSSKSNNRQTPIYKRLVTGSKGIGRFAVRFLGKHLKLISIAKDSAGNYTKLTANFDWTEFSQATDLSNIFISYFLEEISNVSSTGTRLEITNINFTPDQLEQGKDLKTQLLNLATPYDGLENPPAFLALESNVSNVFEIKFFGFDTIVNDTNNRSLSSNLLQNFGGRVRIELCKQNLNIKIFLAGEDSPAYELKDSYPNSLFPGIFADLRFFPNRAGAFKGLAADGRKVKTWLKQNGGVAIYDRGFRVTPYGTSGDDWLGLGKSEALSQRDWESSLAIKHFPIPKEIKNFPSLNWALNLAKNHQIVGIVHVISADPTTEERNSKLIPASAREGFLDNSSFRELVDIVRGGLELLAWRDKVRIQEDESKKAIIRANEIRSEVKEAIKEIETSTTLTDQDRTRIINTYQKLSIQIDEQDEYNRRSRQGLEQLSLLGIIAGFMTHESRSLLDEVSRAIVSLKNFAMKNNISDTNLLAAEKSIERFYSQVRYSSNFIEAVKDQRSSSFRVKPQIELAAEPFIPFLHERGIQLKIEGDPMLMTPILSITLYSGVLMNLLSNAIKALVAGPIKGNLPEVIVRYWNESNIHIVEVIDNGIGIPEALKGRIWDPLFSTTSRLNNPLGSGMGLGLTLVKSAIESFNGKIVLIPPPAGYSTCFKVSYPGRSKI